MSARPKIIMLTTQLGYGGAETSFIRLANYLAQTMEVSVALFTSDYGVGAYAKGHVPLDAPITLLDDAVKCSRLVRWLRRIRRFRALKTRHDVAISFLSGPNLVNVLAGHNGRSVISLRGSRKYDPVATSARRRVFQYLIDPIVYALSARIVPVSAGLANEVIASARHKTMPIPPFVETNKLQQQLSEPAPESYEKLMGQPVVIGVGRLSVEKGFHHLIRIFSALEIPGAKLLLVGDGPMMQDLRAQCQALHLPMDDATPGVTSVLFAGYQKQVMPFMKLAKIYALTSATEGFPSVLLEAMAACVPVIAADTPWGARAILGKESNTAYPTHKATETQYGTLMPRIDTPEYEQCWLDVLREGLTRPAPQNQKAAATVEEYDSAKIGQRWKQLIAELMQ